MITLHRLGHQAEPFELNPDLIVTVEANPDTVVTLTTGTKIVVSEPPSRVIEEIRAYRIAILAGALKARQDPPNAQHGQHARRAASGLLRSVDTGSEDDSADDPGPPQDS